MTTTEPGFVVGRRRDPFDEVPYGLVLVYQHGCAEQIAATIPLTDTDPVVRRERILDVVDDIRGKAAGVGIAVERVDWPALAAKIHQAYRDRPV